MRDTGSSRTAHLVLGGCRGELALKAADASRGGGQRRHELLLACSKGGSESGVLGLCADDVQTSQEPIAAGQEPTAVTPYLSILRGRQTTKAG